MLKVVINLKSAKTEINPAKTATKRAILKEV